MRCRGDDRSGQLGRGAPSDAIGAPREVELPEVRALSAGGDTTCAIDVDGAVWCFGGNRHGQLGDGLREARGAPAPVPGLDAMESLDVGFEHVCAVDPDGAVWCWGWNGSGQVRAGGPLDVEAPTRVEGVPPARAVVAGYSDSCLITEDARAFCWGEVLGAPAELATEVRAIAIGVDHVCVARPTEVRCFGAAPGGARPSLPAEGRGYPIAAGAPASGAIDHACFGDVSGGLLCLGKNEEGQLGDGTFRFADTPVAVRRLDGEVTSVAVGYAHSCAVSGGRTWCWGDNERGVLGPGPDSLDPVLVP